MNNKNKEELLQYLKNNYFKVGSPLYYAGINKIYSLLEKKVSIEEIKDFLQRQDAYPIFKNTNDKTVRNPIYKRFKRQCFQIDLLELRHSAKENKGLGLLLTIIDAYTRYAWAVAIQDKKKDTVLNAFKSVIDKLEEKPLNVISDLGLEFKNAAFEKYCKDNNIKHHFPYTFMHAAIIERFHG